MRTLTLALSLLTFTAGSASAATPTRLAGAPAWVVDKAASRLGFHGEFSGEGFDGSFRRWDAQIAFDPKNLPASRVSVAVDLASAATGDATRDQALPTGDWFDVRRSPRATFVSRSVRSLGPGRFAAEGDLTLRAVKRPLTLPFTLQIDGPVARMTASVPLDRTSFGVGQGQFKGGDTVAAAVTVNVKLVAKRVN